MIKRAMAPHYPHPGCGWASRPEEAGGRSDSGCSARVETGRKEMRGQGREKSGLDYGLGGADGEA